jgi:coenzyme F420 hydrogenase subunit beta
MNLEKRFKQQGFEVLEKAVITQGYCIGCGICAGICPVKCLEMETDLEGLYKPIIHHECIFCGKCIDTCPFKTGNPNEDHFAESKFSGVENIRSTNPVGYYVDNYSGNVSFVEQRIEATSGGITKWLLKKLLSSKYVNGVFGVSQINDPKSLFEYTLANKPEDIDKFSGSAYYPVELSASINYILKNPGKYAIVGLPCFLKGIELAKKNNPILNERIILVVGLVCGQSKTKKYAEYILKELLKLDEKKVVSIKFRKKTEINTVNNYLFEATLSNNLTANIAWKSGVRDIFINKLFTPKACHFCDDTFAEVADIALMDAWLPEFSTENKGTNLLIVRNTFLNEILTQGRNEKEITLNKIPVQKVVKSQQGVTYNKSNILASRLYMYQKNKVPFPEKRINPKNNGFLVNYEINLIEKAHQLSLNFCINENMQNKSILNLLRKFKYLRIAKRMKAIIPKKKLKQ